MPSMLIPVVPILVQRQNTKSRCLSGVHTVKAVHAPPSQHKPLEFASKIAFCQTLDTLLRMQLVRCGHKLRTRTKLATAPAEQTITCSLQTGDELCNCWRQGYCLRLMLHEGMLLGTASSKGGTAGCTVVQAWGWAEAALLQPTPLGTVGCRPRVDRLHYEPGSDQLMQVEACIAGVQHMVSAARRAQSGLAASSGF